MTVSNSLRTPSPTSTAARLGPIGSSTCSRTAIIGKGRMNRVSRAQRRRSGRRNGRGRTIGRVCRHARRWASTRLAQQPRPCPPGQHHERFGPVAAQEQRVTIGKPSFKDRKTAAVRPRFHFSNKRCGGGTEGINIHVAAVAAIPTRARQRHPLGLDTEPSMKRNDLALGSRAFVSARTAHPIILAETTILLPALLSMVIAGVRGARR